LAPKSSWKILPLEKISTGEHSFFEIFY